jgi:hypothetical protein
LAIYRSKYIKKDTIAVVDNLKKDQYYQQSISWLNSFHNPNIKHALNNGEVKICGSKVDGFDKKIQYCLPMSRVFLAWLY